MSNTFFNPKVVQHPSEITQQAKHRQWLAENKSALEEYNRRIEMHGTFSDSLRQF